MAAARGLTRRLLALGGAGALAACGSRQAAAPAAPPDFAAMVRALPPVPAGQGRVVVMREDWVKGEYGEARVVIGGLPPAPLRDGAMVAREVPPGRYPISVERGALDSVDFNDFAVEVRPGGTAYVRLVHYLSDGKPQAASTQVMGHGGRGSNLPAWQTKISNFRFSELPGPPR